MEYAEAIAILRHSNLLLKNQMHALEAGAAGSQEIGPYAVLEYCRQEYEAVELAISALEDLVTKQSNGR